MRGSENVVSQVRVNSKIVLIIRITYALIKGIILCERSVLVVLFACTRNYSCRKKTKSWFINSPDTINRRLGEMWTNHVVIKRNKLLICTAKGMNLKYNMLSEKEPYKKAHIP